MLIDETNFGLVLYNHTNCYISLLVLNKRFANHGSVFCVWLFPCNDSMNLAVRKRLLRLNVICRLQSNV